MLKKLSFAKIIFYFAPKLKIFNTIGFSSIKDVGGAHIAYLAEYKPDGIHGLYKADLIKVLLFTLFCFSCCFGYFFRLQKRVDL